MKRQPCATYTEIFVGLFTQVIQSAYKHSQLKTNIIGPVTFIFFSHRLGMLSHLDCLALFRISKHTSFCVHCIVVKQDKAHAVEGLSSRYVTASCARVTLCIVAQHHYNDKKNNKRSCWVTGCSEESNCLVNIWADENIPQMWDITHNTVKFIKSNEKGYEHCQAVPHTDSNTQR